MSVYWYFACAKVARSEHFLNLLHQAKDIDHLWSSLSYEQWCIDRRYVESWKRICEVRKSLSDYDQRILTLADKGIEVICFDDPLYPALLKEIYAPPLAIFIKGNKQLLEVENKVSIVGTRKPSHYGVQVTRQIAHMLGESGAVGVSGLAYGIDSTVHEAMLQVGRGSIAVVPAALTDDVWGGNAALRLRMERGLSLFLSETVPGEELTKFHFVKRNRLIAGLSRWLIVTEAPSKSGALITAKYALESSREILVVPHSLHNELGAGCLQLISEGASCITSLASLFTSFTFVTSSNKDKYVFGSDREKDVYQKIVQGVPLEELPSLLSVSSVDLLVTLGALVLRGYIEQSPDGSYLAK